MPTDTLAGDGPELRPHPRVTEFQRQAMEQGFSAFRDAAHRLRQPVTSTRVAFGAAARLAEFAHALGGAIAAPAAGVELRDKAKWIIAMSSAVTSLEFCAHLVPDQPLDTTRCETARSELLDFAGDVEQMAYKHPYRRFLGWWMVAVATASRYAEAAHDMTQHQASDRACLSLRMANVNAPVPVRDFSDGYLDKDDVAALCFTDTETAGRWAVRFSGTDDPFPTYDLLDHRRVLWHADRAPEIRAWWLRHDDLPVAEYPTRTPGHRIGDRWLTPIL